MQVYQADIAEVATGLGVKSLKALQLNCLSHRLFSLKLLPPLCCTLKILLNTMPDSTADQTELTLDDELPTGPGAAFTFVYYFSTAAFITALVTAKTFGVSVTTPLPGEFALIGGVIGGTLGALFNRSKTLEVPISSKKKFLHQVNTALSQMGYVLKETQGSVMQYQRPNASRFFTGDIYLQQRDRTAIFVSRASNIRTLAKRLSQQGIK